MSEGCESRETSTQPEGGARGAPNNHESQTKRESPISKKETQARGSPNEMESNPRTTPTKSVNEAIRTPNNPSNEAGIKQNCLKNETRRSPNCLRPEDRGTPSNQHQAVKPILTSQRKESIETPINLCNGTLANPNSLKSDPRGTPNNLCTEDRGTPVSLHHAVKTPPNGQKTLTKDTPMSLYSNAVGPRGTPNSEPRWMPRAGSDIAKGANIAKVANDSWGTPSKMDIHHARETHRANGGAWPSLARGTPYHTLPNDPRMNPYIMGGEAGGIEARGAPSKHPPQPTLERTEAVWRQNGPSLSRVCYLG